MKLELVLVVVLLAGYSAAEDANMFEDPIADDSTEAIEDTQCVLCEFVMRHVQDGLKANRSDDAIEKTVSNICDAVPESVFEECDNFVNEHAEIITHLLTEKVHPNEICQIIQFCQATLPMNIIECGICEVAAFAMNKLLANPKANHGFTHVLQETCHIVPRSKREKCQRVIGKFGPKIYNALTHAVQKAKVCKKIGAC